jgi:DNA-binding response OmpR family regulator
MATRILVVDDSPTIRSVVSTILERSGYDPKVAFDGQDAYSALASGAVKADLVLVDFVMPRMNGYQFCRALRENAELAMTPVVLMSAKADRIRDQFVQQTGALDAITKPFDAQALVAVIENALRKMNTSRSSSTRLPDFEGDDVTGVTAQPTPSAVEYETKRTHVAQVVAQKLASIAARAIVDRPDVVSSPNLASVLAERLSNEAVLDMMEALEQRSEAGGALLSGDLAAVPIGAVLQLLQAENQTGVLICRNGNAEVRTTFRNGGIDLVEASGAGDEFRLGRFFIEEGVLTPPEIDAFTQRIALISTPMIVGNIDSSAAIEAAPLTSASRPKEDDSEAPHSSIQMRSGDEALLDLASNGESQAPETLRGHRDLTSVEAGVRMSVVPATERRDDLHGTVTLPGAAVMDALAAATQKPRPLGMALLAAGKIVESQLRSALTQQSSELLYDVLRWPSGRFELRREPPSELAESAKLGLPVASVVMEGFRRVDEWRVLERTLGSFDTVLLRDDTAFGKLDIASLPSREKAVLDAVDGERTIRGIVAASNLSSFDACRILVQLLEARALRRRAG